MACQPHSQEERHPCPLVDVTPAPRGADLATLQLPRRHTEEGTLTSLTSCLTCRSISFSLSLSPPFQVLSPCACSHYRVPRTHITKQVSQSPESAFQQMRLAGEICITSLGCSPQMDPSRLGQSYHLPQHLRTMAFVLGSQGVSSQQRPPEQWSCHIYCTWSKESPDLHLFLSPSHPQSPHGGLLKQTPFLSSVFSCSDDFTYFLFG